MTSADSASQPLQYPRRTIERAERAFRCAPFQIGLFAAMQQQSVDLSAIAGANGVENRYSRAPLHELTAENSLLWLIQVGLLRREVDGQGLTDSFRLTPLGRRLVEKRRGEPWARPTLADRLLNAIDRWTQLLNWLR